MPIRDSVRASIEIDIDGFLADDSRWTPEVAEDLARAAGIPMLTERHWKILALCREDAARRGYPPDLLRVSELSGFEPEEIERLFPGDPYRLTARIAGLRVPIPDQQTQENDR